MERVSHGPQLGPEFFDRSPDIVAPGLLGTTLLSVRNGTCVSGTIVETEAYLGSGDPGSHASTRGITARNGVMYGAPGTVYVYFTYGMHHMLNLVCAAPGIAGAVLIRAVHPVEGVATMAARRGRAQGVELTNGPGKLAQAFGVDLTLNGALLGSSGLWVYHGDGVDPDRVRTSGRIGLSAGHELELRYFVEDDPYVSKGRPGPRANRRDRSRQEAVRNETG